MAGRVVPAGRWLGRTYDVVLWLAFGWVVANVLFVYAGGQEARAYRIAASLFIFAALLIPRVLTRRPPAPVRVQLDQRTLAWLVAAVLGTWAVVSLPFVRLPFLSDDYYFLEAFRTLGSVLSGPQFFRPGFLATFATLGWLGGDSPVPFHLLSFALHLGSAALVFLLARRIFRSNAAALVAFTVFVLNPLQAEAVIWASGLQDAWWTFFMIAALWCYLGAATRSALRLGATLLLVSAALLFKETAVCFVLLLPVADLLVRDERPDTRVWLEYASFILLAVAYLVVRAPYSAPVDADFYTWPSRPFIRRFVALPYATFSHPWNIEAIAVSNWANAAATLVPAALLFAAVQSRLVTPRVLLGPAILLITALPLYRYYFVGDGLSGSRYLYIGACGWGLLAAEIISIVAARKAVLLSAVAAIAVTSVVSFHLNLRPWREAETLIDTLAVAVREQRDVGQAIDAWRVTHPGPLVMKDGLPHQYKGVWIFANGFPAFTRRVQQTAR